MTTRRSITPARERRMIMAQMAEGYVKEMPDFGFVLTCACGCGTFLRPNTPVIREHIVPLCLGGEDTESNMRLYFKPCADKKTNGKSKATSLGGDRHAYDKTRRLRGETCNGPKKPWPKGRKLQSIPFREKRT